MSQRQTAGTDDEIASLLYELRDLSKKEIAIVDECEGMNLSSASPRGGETTRAGKVLWSARNVGER